MDAALKAIKKSLQEQGRYIIKILNEPRLQVEGLAFITLENQTVRLTDTKNAKEYNLSDPQLTQKLTQAISNIEFDNHAWVTETING